MYFLYVNDTNYRIVGIEKEMLCLFCVKGYTKQFRYIMVYGDTF